MLSLRPLRKPPLLSSRRYIKRIWQVPKDRGPVEYIATLCVKALRKHGWPVDWQRLPHTAQSFMFTHNGGGYDLPPDLADAIAICCRIVAKTYRIDMSEDLGVVTVHRRYRVTEYGQLREITVDLSG